jgi:hypothetical protein
MIGVVGPQTLLQKILNNSSSFFLYPPVKFSYGNFAEVPGIVRSAQDRVRGLFFTGPIPFMIASSSIDRRRPWIYLPYDSTGLLVALLNASLAMKPGGGCRFSVDTVEENETRDVVRETDLKIDSLYTLPYSKPSDPSEEFFHFHVDLFRRGLTDFAMTCVENVMLSLQKEGIPTFKVTPAIPTIRRTIQILNLEIEKTSKDSLKATVGIVVPRFEEKSPSDSERKMIRVHQALLAFSQKYHLLVVPRDYRSFRIIQNLGQLRFQTHDFARNEIYNAVFSSTGLDIDVGYGSGPNITIAEEFAEKALEMSGNNGGVCFIIDGEQAVPISTEKITPILLLEKEGSSPVTENGMTASSLTRYVQVISMIETPFSSADFSRLIKITKKAARKILSSLLALELIEKCGKRHINSRGRPETLYQLSSDHIQKRHKILKM